MKAHRLIKAARRYAKAHRIAKHGDWISMKCGKRGATYLLPIEHGWEEFARRARKEGWITKVKGLYTDKYTGQCLEVEP
jgi:hypothetical protein